MPKKYLHPPLIEAQLEIRISADSIWDPAVPGLMFQKLEGAGFTKRESAKFKEFIINSESDSPELLVHERAVFSKENDSKKVMVGDRIVTIHHVRPYSGWESFKPDISAVVNSIKDTVSPVNLESIMLRYVNRIVLPTENLILKEYFNFVPNIPSDMGDEITAFISGCVFPRRERKDLCRIEMTSGNPTKNKEAVVLFKLEYFQAMSGFVTFDNFVEWLEQAHAEIERMFELSITDKMRKVFDQ